MSLFLAVVLTMLVLLFLITTIHELIRWLVLVGIHISIKKYDANYGISLDFQLVSDDNVTSCLQDPSPNVTPPLICCVPAGKGVRRIRR